MSALSLNPVGECRYDILSMGEVMLRLDPGEGRIRTARKFRAWEGGGEYNVAHGALAMTTPGDTTMASLAEVEKMVAGAGARVDR